MGLKVPSSLWALLGWSGHQGLLKPLSFPRLFSVRGPALLPHCALAMAQALGRREVWRGLCSLWGPLGGLAAGGTQPVPENLTCC